MTVTLERARSHLTELITSLTPGDGLVIVSDGQPVATLTRTPRTNWPCHAGSAKDTPHWMAPDFDAPLDEFREYME